MKGRAWTDEEIETLRRLYPVSSRRAVMQALGRGKGSICHRVKVLGLQKLTNPWTAQDIAKLRQLYPGRQIDATAQLLGRSRKAVIDKAWELGIKHRPIVKPPAIKLEPSAGPPGTDQRMADYSRRAQLGLPIFDARDRGWGSLA